MVVTDETNRTIKQMKGDTVKWNCLCSNKDVSDGGHTQVGKAVTLQYNTQHCATLYRTAHHYTTPQ